MRPANSSRPASCPGTATPAAGRPTKVPAHLFTTPVALLDLRGTCRTLVLDLAPLTMASLAQALTLVPVVLAPEAAPKEERRLQMALCAVARLQENAMRASTMARSIAPTSGAGARSEGTGAISANP